MAAFRIALPSGPVFLLPFRAIFAIVINDWKDLSCQVVPHRKNIKAQLNKNERRIKTAKRKKRVKELKRSILRMSRKRKDYLPYM